MKTELLKLSVLTAIVAVAMPELAFAEGGSGSATIGGMMKHVAGEELSKAPLLISAAGYVIGAILILSGALSLKKHSENPAGEPLGKGLGRLIVGAVITSLPALLSLIQKSSDFKAGEEGADFKSLATTF